MKTFIFFFLLVSFSFGNSKFVARVYYNDVSDYDKLHAYDILEYNNLSEKYFLALVNDDAFNQLKNEGWKVEKDAPQSSLIQQAVMNFSGGYKNVNEIYDNICSITTAFPNITEIIDYGDAYCKSLGGLYLTPGNDTQEVCDLLAVKITNKKTSGEKPVFFLMAGIHAREITTPEVALRFINFLTLNYQTNADVRWLVDYNEIWVVPSANPEGHWIVELGSTDKYGNYPFYQRKNANHDDGATCWQPNNWCQYGVDLNRNFSYNWGGAGTSTNPGELVFRGQAAASEPETSCLQNLLTNLFKSQRQEGQPASTNTSGLLISLHSYSELVLWPWAYTSANAPNKSELKMMGDKFASFNNYTSEQSSSLYPTTGDTTDWTYGKLGVPAFTFELGGTSDGFMPPYERVDSDQWPRNKPALLYAAKIARAPYQLINGPDVSEISFAPGTGNCVVITAKVDDTKNGGQNIASARLFLNNPYSSNPLSYQMQAADGSFDSNIENVFIEISATNFFDDEKIIFVNGTDDSGYAGPPSAIFSEIVPEPFFLSFFIFFMAALHYKSFCV